MEIPGYQIERLIAEGGMSSVYLAVQESLGRRVAIKVLRKFGNTQQAERFLHEARIIASLANRNIITIHDVGAIGDRYYIAMEYLEGGSLAERIDHGLPPLAALGLLERMARCLDFVHRRDIVHRDIKPSNILFHADGTPKLTDFGIAKQLDADQEVTLEGSAFGSPYYLSPEQAEGRSLDGRSDIYSLGIVFFQMLTGHKPYAESSHIETIVAHLSNPIPVLPDKLARYQGLLEQMIAKSPENRVASARELVHLIRNLRTSKAKRHKTLAGIGGNAAQPDSSVDLTPGILGRMRAASAVTKGFAVFGLLAAALGLGWLLETPESDRIVDLQRMPHVELSYSREGMGSSKETLIRAAEKKARVENAPAEVGANWQRTEVSRVSNTAPVVVDAALFESVDDAVTPAQLAVTEQQDVEEAPGFLMEPETATQTAAVVEVDVEVDIETETATGAAAETRAADRQADLIAGHMKAGDKALLADRLTTPAADNAYTHYMSVVELDREHQGANAGIDRIAERYAALARSAKGQQNYPLARLYLRRGFAVRRGHAGLLAIRNDIDREEVLAGSKQASADQAPVPLPQPRMTSWEFEGTSVTSSGPEGTGNIVKDFKNVWRSVFE
jgi:serine/threonine-protein kinase PpkA